MAEAVDAQCRKGQYFYAVVSALDVKFLVSKNMQCLRFAQLYQLSGSDWFTGQIRSANRDSTAPIVMLFIETLLSLHCADLSLD